MKRYACNIMYEYDEIDVQRLLRSAIQNLGFTPMFMDVFFQGMKNPLDDAKFEVDTLFSNLRLKPGAITIKSQLYDENNREDFNWFRMKLIFGGALGLNYCSFEWSNTNLDFLLNDNTITDIFFQFNRLLYCYCYDQYDNMNQSDVDISSFKQNYPDEKFKIIKNYMGDEIVDISNHWGRYINVKGITFMAAPQMWFGEGFAKFILLKDLAKFNGSSFVSSHHLVHIALFDLKSNPAESQNRQRQKNFWQYFNLETIANKIQQFG